MSVIHVTEQTFKADVLDSEKPVIVDFWATWCGPCMMLAPVLEEIAAEHPELVVAKVDVDENPQLAMAFGISSIPAVMLFKDGKIAGASIGYRPKASLLATLGI